MALGDQSLSWENKQVFSLYCRYAKPGEAPERRHRARTAKNPPTLEENPHLGGGYIQVLSHGWHEKNQTLLSSFLLPKHIGLIQILIRKSTADTYQPEAPVLVCPLFLRDNMWMFIECSEKNKAVKSARLGCVTDNDHNDVYLKWTWKTIIVWLL